jgi:Protein of unknown function (DUF5656)
MEENRNLPDVNQLSILSSTILLAYALTPFVKVPIRTLNLQLSVVKFSFHLDFTTLVSLLVAALAAVGTEWLLRSHPVAKSQRMVQHWILPALTAWVIGVPLHTLAVGLQWWVVFALGGVLMVLVFIAEYIVVDLSDLLYAPASMVLTALSFALFLFLAIAVWQANLRLYLLLPALVVPVALVSLRTLYLRLGGKWCFAWAVGIAVVIGQMTIGMHYLYPRPLAFGLFLLGPAYALTSLAAALEEGTPTYNYWMEPSVMLGVIWGLGFLVR